MFTLGKANEAAKKRREAGQKPGYEFLEAVERIDPSPASVVECMEALDPKLSSAAPATATVRNSGDTLSGVIWQPYEAVELDAWKELAGAAEKWEAMKAGQTGTEAPLLCNTGASNSQKSHTSSLPGGIDTLSASLWVLWSSDAWSNLRESLEAAKKYSQTKGQNGVVKTPFGEMLLAPKGAAHGSEDFVIGCAWVARWNGITFHIADRQSPAGDSLPNVFVNIGALPLTEFGHARCWAAVLAMVAHLGGTLTKNVVGRADLCADVPNGDLGDLVKRYQKRKFLTRARKDGDYAKGQGTDAGTDGEYTLQSFREGLVATGFTIGIGIHLRVYDKIRETQNNCVKRALLTERRWGGKTPDKAFRVEFQLRREQLRERWSVASVEDLFSKLGTIAEELTGKWVRFVQGTIDRENNHHSRAKTCPVWERVQKLFREWTKEGNAPAPRRTKFAPFHRALFEQWRGCAVTIFALSGLYGPVCDPREAAWDLIIEWSREEWIAAVAERAKELKARGVPVRVSEIDRVAQARYEVEAIEDEERRREFDLCPF